MNTLPPQIDYVSPSKKKKLADAERFIGSLPEADKNECENIIVKQIDDYYESDAPRMDAMF